uniref:Cathepsin propeptide inhibitor domain-containing protein n=1 Tax=Eptatretus burgeri TaxID=7764 RepID=A0A8C4QNH0_EPTBU
MCNPQATEEYQRHLVWEENLERILKHNLEYSLGKHSWTMEMNKFGDMKPKEFHKTMNGYRHPAGRLHGAHATFLPPAFFHPPPSIDWRDYGFVTNVKDQDDQQCLFDPRLSVTSLSTYVDIPQGNETALKIAVASEGPVSVAIDASNASFQFYSSGEQMNITSMSADGIL